MNKEIMQKILQKIKEYDRIMLFRHVRNDGDCVGATKGLKGIIQLTWPEKEVYLIDLDTATYLEFMGPEDEPVPEDMYKDAQQRRTCQGHEENRRHAVLLQRKRSAGDRYYGLLQRTGLCPGRQRNRHSNQINQTQAQPRAWV